MSIGSVVAWIVCGLIVGLCAQLLAPGRQSLSLPMTVLLGVVGALLGGFLYSLARGPSVEPFSLVSHNWYGWIVAVLGATLLVWGYRYANPRRWWN